MNRKASLRGISSGLGRLTTKWLKKKKGLGVEDWEQGQVCL